MPKHGSCNNGVQLQLLSIGKIMHGRTLQPSTVVTCFSAHELSSIRWDNNIPYSCTSEIFCRMMSLLPRSRKWRHAVKRTPRRMLGRELSCRTLLQYHSTQWIQKQQSSMPSSCMSSYSRMLAVCLPCTASWQSMQDRFVWCEFTVLLKRCCQ